MARTKADPPKDEPKIEAPPAPADRIGELEARVAELEILLAATVLRPRLGDVELRKCSTCEDFATASLRFEHPHSPTMFELTCGACGPRSPLASHPAGKTTVEKIKGYGPEHVELAARFNAARARARGRAIR